MRECLGTIYLSGSSDFFEAGIRVDERGTVLVSFGDYDKAYTRKEYDVEPALGSSNRILRFHDGTRFETDNRLEFSECEKLLPKSGLLGTVNSLESKWSVAVGCVLGIALFLFAFFKFGMPVLAESIVSKVPQSLRETLSAQSLKAMERYGSMEESYSAKIHNRAKAAFDRGLELLGQERSVEYSYELKIYTAPGIGANAFALPSGLIVATEAFVDLCETEEQMVAVFLHEFAHVERQHGLRSLVQDAGIFVVVSLAFGDLSSLGGMAASLPALAIESRYSRGFEAEADLFAGVILDESGIGASAMKEALILLHQDVPDIDIASFLATHPDLEERLKALDSLADDSAYP